MIILLKFPEYALECINIITSNGFDAYFVGGCVRDSLLNIQCDDIDITTNAQPDDIISIFPKTIPTGLKHGTVTVIHKDKKLEITTYRTEEEYTDYRHPNAVNFVSDLSADLSRRDFTINALACSSDYQLVDNFNGISDIENRIIKAVGNPEKRFKEDALRIIRAFRFSAVLGFEIEENTKFYAKKLSNLVCKISGERILKELIKASDGKKPSALCELISTGVLTEFGIHSQKFTNEIFDRISAINLKHSSKFALLILLCNHDIIRLKTTLKVDNDTIKIIKSLDELVMLQAPENKAQIQKLLYKYGTEAIILYLHYLNVIKPVAYNHLLSMQNEIIDNCEPYLISQLAIDGNDLLSLGYKGSIIKTTLEKALFSVIDGNVSNKKTDLLEYIKKLNHQ